MIKGGSRVELCYMELLTVIVTSTVLLYGTVDSYRNVYSCVIWNC